MDNKEWLKVYLDNYNERSDIAKSLKGQIKENYKKNSYIPWATMERLVYECDPNAEYEVVTDKIVTEGDTNESIVHTIKQTCTIIKEGVATTSVNFAHFIKIKLVFLGKTFIEEYPIQDNSYDPVKFIDCNVVNKAIQRGKAKIASRATGIGLKLYEGTDLQFDGPEEPKKELPKKEITKAPIAVNSDIAEKEPTRAEAEKYVQEIGGVSKVVGPVEDLKVKEVVVETITPPMVAESNTEIEEFIKVMKEGDANVLDIVFQGFNKPLINKYGFSIAVDDLKDEKVLVAKLAKITNLKQFKEAVINKIGKGV